jgi:hypothetical protein
MASMALFLAPAIAWARLPFFGLDVDPVSGTDHPDDDVLLRRGPYATDVVMLEQPRHDGVGSPLDEEGRLDRADGIAVEGHETSSGATRGRITLNEPGAYDVVPLWRGWGADHSEGSRVSSGST